MPDATDRNAPPAAPAALPTPARLRALVDRLGHGLLERDAAVRLALLAALAGEHLLLLGPPGTAKSALARRLHRAFDGARYFERLLTRFSTPEELFGPLSLKALEDDRYERLVDGWLPTAGIAFLDEVFKANSAILNALLTLLNERAFDNGTQRLAVPLVCVIGASNEPPADESLLAFHDRFLLRVPVAPVSDAAFGALLALDDAVDAELDSPAANSHAAPAPIRADERAALDQAAAQVRLGDDALAAFAALRAQAAALAHPVSDRRWRQLVALLRRAVACEGRAEIDAIDLWLAPYVVAPDAAAVPGWQQWVDHTLAGVLPQPLTWLGHAVTAFEKQAQIEQRLPADESGAADDSAGKLALARAFAAGADGGADADAPPADAGANAAMPRLTSERLAERLRRRFSPRHVAARLAQVDEVAAHAASAQATVQVERDDLQRRVADRLWLPPELSARWLAQHDDTLARLHALAGRLAAARAVFAALPQDDTLPDHLPPPVALDAAAAAAP